MNFKQWSNYTEDCLFRATVFDILPGQTHLNFEHYTPCIYLRIALYALHPDDPELRSELDYAHKARNLDQSD